MELETRITMKACTRRKSTVCHKILFTLVFLSRSITIVAVPVYMFTGKGCSCTVPLYYLSTLCVYVGLSLVSSATVVRVS